MEYNREFKIIDTEEKAYFLGLMYADGSISKARRRNSTYVKHQVQISLIDEDLIKDLHNLFPFFNIQEFDFGKYKSNWSKQFALRKANKLLFDDLLNQGILQRKSEENKKNLKFPKLHQKFISHFIRGYFDGDGSINISKKRPNLRRIEICSSSINFLTELKTILQNNNINCPIFREKNNNKSPLYVLEWVNSKDVLSLKKFFYENSNIYLKRKKEKFDSFKIIDKKKLNPVCPNCFANKSQKAGSRMMKHGLMNRYTCMCCNKKFSIPAQLKQDELLENPTPILGQEDNQHPSLDSNIFEGSTTNRRVPPTNVEDSNSDTSVLPSITLHNFIINKNNELVKAYWSDDIV